MGKQPIVLQSGQAPPQQLVKILVSAASLPPLPAGKSSQPAHVTGGPLGPQPMAMSSPPKAPPTPTTTTSGPTPVLAAKLSDLNLICVDDAAEGAAASGAAASGAKAVPEMINLLSDEETDKEDADQREEQRVRRVEGVALV